MVGVLLHFILAVVQHRREANTDTKTRSFIKTPGNHTDWEKGNFSIPADVVRVLRKAGISGALLSNVYSDSCYWAKMGDQHYSRYDENGNLASFGMFSS